MENLGRNKYLMQLIVSYNGPVHQAFVYTYYQLYIQETDMYNYTISNSLSDRFTSKELNILENERRPSKLNLSLLYKVLKICCSPPLSAFEDPVWMDNNIEKCSDNSPCEVILTSLLNSYKNFLLNANNLPVEKYSNMIDNLCHNASILIKKSSMHSGFSRWPEEKERLEILFEEIKNFVFSLVVKTPLDYLELEAHFRADLCEAFLIEILETVDPFGLDLKLFNFDSEDENFNKYFELKNHFIDTAHLLEHIISQIRKLWIVGEHGVGKSVLAAYIVHAWNNKCIELNNLQKFKLVVTISLAQMLPMNLDNIFSVAFPISSSFIDSETIAKCVMENKTLIILDDVNGLGSEIIRRSYDSANLTVWLIGRFHGVSKYAEDKFYKKDSLFLELNGFNVERILTLSEKWTKKSNEIPDIKIKLEDNMNRFYRILKYPSLLQEVCQMWVENYSLLKDVYTCSELMWELLSWNARRTMKISIKHKGGMRKKFFRWLMQAGELSLYYLKQNSSFDTAALDELKTEITLLFPENGKNFLETIFNHSIIHSSASCNGPLSSTNKSFLEYCSSWFLMEQLLANKRMTDLTFGFSDTLPLVLFSAGHLERLQDEGNITMPEERKLIRTLLNYKEGGCEDFNFIQEFVVELKCIKRLVEIVIDETEYDEEWNLNVSSVQQRSLEVLLSHVSPTRLIFLADDFKKNYELTSVLNYVCRVDISVWLDSSPQFTYGNKENIDHLLEPFLEEYVIPRVDLISGCLSSSIMQQLAVSKSTRHLVLLRLKVNNTKALNSALSLPKQLPHILWLEVKFDMDLPQATELNHSTKVELFDVHLAGIDDSDITDLTDLLTTMHLHYTGIHLDDSSLTPEGVYTLLKELGRRGVNMRAKQDVINKFRRWYYPALSGVSRNDSLSEEEYIELIGHDDRQFYSDHHVVSSRFVTVLDAWNLRNYLENHDDIRYFTYEANNIIFTKQLSGEVEISFKGNYKEIIEEKVITEPDDIDIKRKGSKIIDMF